MTKKLKLLLFILLSAFLWLPLLQRITHFVDNPGLKGAFEKPPSPEFSLDAIQSLQFQKQLEDYENFNFGFRALFVKIKNSLEYIFFRKINAPDLIEGQDGYLFSYGSVERTMGNFYNGKDKNANTVDKINHLKWMIERHGGQLLIVLAPSKEAVIPEKLPSTYHFVQPEQTDYNDLIEDFKKYNISYIDFCSYFKAIPDSIKNSMITKTGFHWSMYGASMAQDSIFKYLQNVLPYELPQYIHKGNEWSDTAMFSDADFEGPMNLLFSLNQPQYVYPKLEMIPSTLKKRRPKAIIIGDSFFWQIKDLKTIVHIFSEDSRYWYYFSQSFPLSDEAGSPIKDVNIANELASADIVLLFGSMGTMDNFPFGVTDHYLNKLTKLESIINLLEEDSEWKNDLQNRAKSQGASLEDIIFTEAENINNTKKIFQLKAANDKFVCADGANNNVLIADRDSAWAWETFFMLRLKDDKCVIYSYNDNYISPELSQANKIIAAKNKITENEIFTLVNVDSNTIALKASNGLYVSLDKKTSHLFANSREIGELEKFMLMPQ